MKSSIRMPKGLRSRLLAALNAARRVNACVIGDDISDVYWHAEAIGYANKSMAPVVRRKGWIGSHEGGTAATARHLSALVRNVTVLTPSLRIEKHRFVELGAEHRVLVEFLVQPREEVPYCEVRSLVGKVPPSAGLIVCMDYGHGLFAVERPRFAAETVVLNVQSNAWSRGLTNIRDWLAGGWAPTLLCMNEREIQEFARCRAPDVKNVTLPCPFLVTRGKDGLYHSLFGSVPGIQVPIKDRTGAGDAACAVAAALTAVKADPDVVAWGASIAGALKTRNIMGNARGITRQELIDFIRSPE